MSLVEQWYAARVRRQQEMLERQQLVAQFLQETRSYHQQLWHEQRQQRTAYVAAMRDYVWGTAPTPPGNGSNQSTRSSIIEKIQPL